MAPKKELAQAMQAAWVAATPQEKENAARAVARFGGDNEVLQAYLYLRSNAARRALSQVPAFRYRHGVRLRCRGKTERWQFHLTCAMYAYEMAATRPGSSEIVG